MTITGTQSLSSSDLAELEGKIVGGCYDDDSDELEERVRALFQDRGYFRAQIQRFQITPLDPLTTPKHVKVEAEIFEGELFRLKGISFIGNHHFPSEQLRKVFPLKEGDLFERRPIVGGLEGMRKLYTSEGYIDILMIPNTTFTGSGVQLSIEVKEGPQYHMGKLTVFAKKELAEQLQAAWDLEEGTTYDAGYPDKFVDEHHELLPANFTSSQIQLVPNCPDAVVNVRLVIDQVQAAWHPAVPVKCAKDHTLN